MNLLKRELAPLTDEAWAEIDDQARRIIQFHLSGRTLVDFRGPHGWQFGAVDTGHLDLAGGASGKGDGEVAWARRRVVPLVEARVPFHLDRQQMDDVSRGARDADLSPLEDAARRIAKFEESAIYNGFEGAAIAPLADPARKPIRKLGKDPLGFPGPVGEAVKTLRGAGIEGPYALVLGTEPFHALMESLRASYPPYRVIRELLQGDIFWSPALEGGVVLSRRGGDFELTIGQDFSIGYVGCDREKIELFLTESFTFRVLEPRAAVALRAGGE